MEGWDCDYINLVEPGHILVKPDGIGLIVFGAVQANIDYRVEKYKGDEHLAFTFDGVDEGDPINGRGWAELKGEYLICRMQIHMGDDIVFTAEKNR